MGAVYDDLPGHEGYAVEHGRRHVAACSCGWRDHDIGAAGDPEAATERWDEHQAAGLLERAVPQEVTDLVDDTRRAVAHLARVRPNAAGVVLDQLDRAISQLRGLAHDADRTTPTVGQRLHAFRCCPSSWARPVSPIMWDERDLPFVQSVVVASRSRSLGPKPDELVLREGTHDNVRQVIDVDVLLDQWDVLVLPPRVRPAWSEWFLRHRRVELASDQNSAI